MKESYENFHKVSYEDNVIETIVKLSSRYITDRQFPDKAIDILDEMSICAVPPGHYAEVDMTPTEQLLIKKTEEANGIK